jgi:hypothetical protein
MVDYPVRVPSDYYRGRNEKRRRKADRYNDIAERIENYLNLKIREEQDQEAQSYFYSEIALELGFTVDEVCNVLFSIDCGSNGLTVYKEGAPIKNFTGRKDLRADGHSHRTAKET